MKKIRIRSNEKDQNNNKANYDEVTTQLNQGSFVIVDVVDIVVVVFNAFVAVHIGFS